MSTETVSHPVVWRFYQGYLARSEPRAIGLVTEQNPWGNFAILRDGVDVEMPTFYRVPDALPGLP